MEQRPGPPRKTGPFLHCGARALSHDPEALLWMKEEKAAPWRLKMKGSIFRQP